MKQDEMTPEEIEGIERRLYHAIGGMIYARSLLNQARALMNAHGKKKGANRTSSTVDRLDMMEFEIYTVIQEWEEKE